MRCYRKILRISCKDHVINEEVRAKIQQVIGLREDLLIIAKRHKLKWYGQTEVIWTCLPFIRSSQIHLSMHSERRQKTRQTDEKMGRQHQGMDRPGVRQVPEGRGEHIKMEETGCKVICDAPTTLLVKG